MRAAFWDGPNTGIPTEVDEMNWIYSFVGCACLCGSEIRRHLREVVQDRGSRGRPDQVKSRAESGRNVVHGSHLVFCSELDEGRKIGSAKVDVEHFLLLMRTTVAGSEEDFIY